MEYSKFKIEDFVTDEYFMRWVKKPDAQTSAFWTAWLSKNACKVERVRKAREIILLLDFRINHPPRGTSLQVWERIMMTGDDHERRKLSGESGSDFSGLRKTKVSRTLTGLVIGNYTYIKVRGTRFEVRGCCRARVVS